MFKERILENDPFDRTSWLPLRPSSHAYLVVWLSVVLYRPLSWDVFPALSSSAGTSWH